MASTSADAERLPNNWLTVEVAAYAPVTPNAPLQMYENAIRLNIKYKSTNII